MKKAALPIVLALLIVVMSFSTLYGQQNRGRIIGTVLAPNGSVVPGVKVTISSDALIARTLSSISNDRGMYRFVLLPVGTYSIELEREGYKTLKESGVVLDFGSTITVNKTLQPTDFEETLVITGEAPIVDKTSSTMSDKLDAEFLQKMPSGRNIFSMPQLTAGFNDQSSLGGTYQAGNLYSADGLDMSDPTTKRPKDVVSFETVEQMDVAKFGAQAEYGTFTGAAINVITKSGGNDFHGEAGYYMRRVDWTDDNTGEYKEYGITLPTASDQDNPTVAFGGPILKDKIWFFAAYNQKERTTQRELQNNVQFDGSDDVKNWFGKISTQWNQKNITYLSYTGWSENEDDWARYSSHRENFESTLCMWDQRIDSTLLQHSSALTDDLILEFRYNKMLYDSLQHPKEVGPTIRDSRLGWLFLSDTVSRSDYNYKERENLDVTANIFKDSFYGSHSAKAGFQYGYGVNDHEYSHEEYIEYRNGVPYRWRNYGTYFNSRRVYRIAGFFQDSWTLSDRLTLNLGIRYDYTWSRGPDNTGAANGEKFREFKDFAPRLGFAYDLFGDGKTVVRGFFGRYYEGVVSGNIRPMIAEIPETQDYRWNSSLSEWYLYDSYGGWQNFTMSDDLENIFTEGYILAVERQITETISGSVTWIHKWDKNFYGRTYPDVTWTEQQISFSNENGSYNGVNYRSVRNGVNELFQNITEDVKGILEDPFRRYFALMFEMKKRMKDNWSLLASYTWSRNTGNIYNDDYDVIQGFTSWTRPNGWINSSGLLDLDRTHVLKVSGTYIAPFDINISPVISYMTGRPAPLLLSPSSSDSLRIKPMEGEERYDTRTVIDLRIEKTFLLKQYRFGAFFDVFNMLNDDAVTAWASNNIDSSNFMVPSSIIGPRYYQIGVRFAF